MIGDPVRAQVYAGLAEALAPDGPPDWMAQPGCDWPIYSGLVRLAGEAGGDGSAAWRGSQALAQVPPEPVSMRMARFKDLFCRGRPKFWMYESAFLSGRLSGPETLEVEKWYRAAGLQVAGPELPDHASVELSFLAILAGLGDAIEIERAFLTQHAGRWLPDLGRALATSDDLVYRPLGELLSGWLPEALPAAPRRSPRVNGNRGLPAIASPESCTLCGFCARVCPAKALTIRDTSTETILALSPASCTGCGRCVRLCEFQVLQLAKTTWLGEDYGRSEPVILSSAPLVACLQCGEAIASQAEMQFLRLRLGSPAWLYYCSDCRSVLEEVVA